MLDKPVISFVVPPVTVTLPVLIVPTAPSNLTALVPPVVKVLFTPSIMEEPIAALPTRTIKSNFVSTNTCCNVVFCNNCAITKDYL